MGGDYQINTEQLRNVSETGISEGSVEQLENAGFQITDAGLTALADQFDNDTADELREEFLGETFTARRDLERLLRGLDDPIRQTRDRKTAAELFAVTIIGERYDTADQFRAALVETKIDSTDHDVLTEFAYTGWTWTTDNFKLLKELPSTLRFASNTAFYVVCTLAFNILFGLFLALSTFTCQPHRRTRSVQSGSCRGSYRRFSMC